MNTICNWMIDKQWLDKSVSHIDLSRWSRRAMRKAGLSNEIESDEEPSNEIDLMQSLVDEMPDEQEILQEAEVSIDEELSFFVGTRKIEEALIFCC